MSASRPIRYARGATRPDTRLWIFGDDKTLINFSTGYTFFVRIGNRGWPALLDKSTGITGQAGTGNKDTLGSIPNLIITWASGDLDIDPGEYSLQINADAGGGTVPRYFFIDFEITDVVLAAV